MTIPGFITRNFRLKVGCTLLALVTWVGVVYAGNPPEERTVSVPVPQQLSAIPPGFQLVRPVSDLQVRIGGSRSSLDAFSPSSMLAITVDWRVVHQPGVQQVPVSISNSDPAVELVDPPASITADLDSIGSVSIPVTIRITNLPPAGYVISGQSANPSSLVVTGPQHELAGLSVVVTVDLANRKTNFEQDVTPLVYDAHGNQVGDVDLKPNEAIQVTITVSSPEATRSVAVVPDLLGSPGGGHELTGVIAYPLTVVLTGPADLLNSLDSVSTAPIYLNGRTGNDVVVVPLQLAAGVTASPGTVTITLIIRPLPASPTPSPSPSPSPTAP